MPEWRRYIRRQISDLNLAAATADVRMMVVREGAVLAGLGTFIGLIAASAGARVLCSIL